jgi:hypothetical protein
VRIRILGLVAVLLFGVLRFPVEHVLHKRLQAAGFQQVNLDLEMRDQLGQSAFIAAFSGFRALVGAFLWIEAYDAWTRTDWGRMNFLMNSTVSLQPRSVTYWTIAAWHMAWNAGVSAREDKSIPRESLRIRAEREYWDLGESYYFRGLKANPDSWELYQQYAFFLEQKRRDHCAAAEYYAKAAEFPEAPAYVARMAAIQLAQCPGREREAYEKLRALYLAHEGNRLPTLLRLVKEFENRLEIPPDLRLLND